MSKASSDLLVVKLITTKEKKVPKRKTKTEKSPVVAVVAVTRVASYGLERINSAVSELSTSGKDKELEAARELFDKVEDQSYDSRWSTSAFGRSLKDQIGELIEAILEDMPDAADSDRYNQTMMNSSPGPLDNSKEVWLKIVKQADELREAIK